MFRCCTDSQTDSRQTGGKVSELDRIKYRDAELRTARSESQLVLDVVSLSHPNPWILAKSHQTKALSFLTVGLSLLV